VFNGSSPLWQANPFTTNMSVCRRNCCSSSPAQSFLASGFVEIYGLDFASLLHMYVIINGASPSTRGEVDLSVRALCLLHRSFSTTDC
jgi:hypothetical protein